MEQAVQTVATNVARILKLKNKGRIEPGYDADLLLINRDYEISHLFARGALMTEGYRITRKGYYEG
jgi:beta-aspartyl-dipeptidase (metallo-type)